MHTSNETLMATLKLEPDKADLSLLYDVPRDKYIQTLFLLTFRRWATEEDEQMDKGDMSDEDFKQAVQKSVYESTERRIKKGVVYNYVNHSNEYTYSVGKFKRRVRLTMTKIKAKIPLKVKQPIKDLYLKIRG